jgi:hypothetical protein
VFGELPKCVQPEAAKTAATRPSDRNDA